jgi:hypothetical protein
VTLGGCMTKQELLEIAIKFTNKTGQLPSRNDLISLGISRDVLRNKYGTMDALYLDIKKKSNILDIRDINSSKPSPSIKRFIISTVVTGAKVDSDFLDSIDTYCKKNKAELILIPTLDSKQKITIDSSLKGRKFITVDTKLNESCTILGINAKSRTVDSTSGLNRVGRRNGTVILAGTKRNLKYVATTNSKMPHAIMSTGAITLPDYGGRHLMRKSDYIADQDHTVGAVVVELEANGFYHFRQITADKTGAFIDLGVKYSGTNIKKIETKMILGDWHVGITCPIVKKETLLLSDKLNIKTWIMHDVFDAYSISHHDKGKQAVLAIKANRGLLSLKKELDDYVADLILLSKKRQLVIVKSNHDEHLERYLSEARYIKHPHNHQLGLQLANALINGNNPLEWYTKQSGKKINVRWLKRDEDYIVAGVHLGAHGDKGPNGSRGSIAAMESSYGNVVYGHSHTPQILREAYCVGTSTHLKPDYGLGAPSSWMNTHCLIYPNGQRQLINLINGKFTTMDL